MNLKSFTDPFAIVALLSIVVFGYIFYTFFFDRQFTIFTDEDQIGQAKEAEFGFLAHYL